MALFEISFYDHGPIDTLFFLATLVPSLAVGARRLHDIDRSGWSQLLVFAIVIGWIVLIVWFVTKGEGTENRFGPPPKPVTEG